MTAINTRGITWAEFMDSARAVVSDLLQMAVDKARLKIRIKELEDQLAEKQAGARERLKANMGRCVVYLMSVKPEFLARRKKTIQEGSVSAGFRSVANVEIDDPPAVIAWARENGYTDVIEEPPPPPPPKISKTALRKRLVAKEKIPGCRLLKDFEPFVEPIKSLREAAAEGNATALLGCGK